MMPTWSTALGIATCVISLALLSCGNALKYDATSKSLRNHATLVEDYSTPTCSAPTALGMENRLIPDSAITASSWLYYNTDFYGPQVGRLNLPTVGPWVKHDDDATPWIQVDLSAEGVVTGLQTQGGEGQDKAVTAFKVRAGTEPCTDYITDSSGSPVIFTAVDHAITTHNFPQPVAARYVRIEPTQWREYCALRFEIFGCLDIVRCPLGWDEFNGVCYFLDHSAGVSFTDAIAACNQKGSALASIHSDEEQSFLAGLIRGNGQHWHGYYIGLNDIATEGTFVWNDGTPLDYTSWTSGEPNNYGNEDCVGMWPNGGGNWNDYPCGGNYPYICEKRLEISLSGKIATQSSTYGGNPGPASRAIDGNTDSSYTGNSCTHTNQENNAWWMVNQGNSQCVGTVAIYNRQDCCKERLQGAVVRVGPNSDRSNPTCGSPITLEQINANAVIEVPCNLEGRYLSIELTSGSEPLTLCEVKIYAGECASTIRNRLSPAVCAAPVGLGMESGQLASSFITASTVWDDNPDSYGPRFARLSTEGGRWVPHRSDFSPWIQVDLYGAANTVSGVITQGSPVNDEWVTSFKVRAGTEECDLQYIVGTNNLPEEYPGNSDRDTEVTHLFPNPVTARFVRIEPTDWKVTSSLRFEVIGCFTSTTPPTCETGWKIFDGSCYYFSDTAKATFAQAETECQNRGAMLPSIHSKDEQDFIAYHTSDDGSHTYYGYWIGLTDRTTEGTFQWVDGTPTDYTNWSSGEPNNHGSNEDCAGMWPRGGDRWNDYNCDSDYLSYVCKKQG